MKQKKSIFIICRHLTWWNWKLKYLYCIVLGFLANRSKLSRSWSFIEESRPYCYRHSSSLCKMLVSINWLDVSEREPPTTVCINQPQLYNTNANLGERRYDNGSPCLICMTSKLPTTIHTDVTRQIHSYLLIPLLQIHMLILHSGNRICIDSRTLCTCHVTFQSNQIQQPSDDWPLFQQWWVIATTTPDIFPISLHPRRLLSGMRYIQVSYRKLWKAKRRKGVGWGGYVRCIYPSTAPPLRTTPVCWQEEL